MKRTPWFPANIKPIRDGEYEWWIDACKQMNCPIPHMDAFTKSKGWQNKFTDADLSKLDGFKWRGLAQDPKAGK